MSKTSSTNLLSLIRRFPRRLEALLRRVAPRGLLGRSILIIVLPVLLKLFRCDDKHLRKFLHSVIISDLKKLNKNAKVVNINRRL